MSDQIENIEARQRSTPCLEKDDQEVCSALSTSSDQSHGTTPSHLDDEDIQAQHGAVETVVPSTEAADTEMGLTRTLSGIPYSIYTPRQKRFIVFMAAFGGIFSPISGTIYFPALNPLSADLHVSNSLINLTLTSYMVG